MMQSRRDLFELFIEWLSPRALRLYQVLTDGQDIRSWPIGSCFRLPGNCLGAVVRAILCGIIGGSKPSDTNSKFVLSILILIQQGASSSHHASATCKMGLANDFIAVLILKGESVWCNVPGVCRQDILRLLYVVCE